MAKRVVVTTVVIDDFDRTELHEDEAEAVEFIFEGIKYVVDTNNERAEQFRAFLTPWMEVSKDKEKVKLEGKKKPVATKATGPLQIESSDASTKAAQKRQRDAVREWATANGIKVGQRRLSQDVLDAYAAATGIIVDGGWGPRPVTLTTQADEPPPASESDHLPPGHFLPGANSSGVTPDMREWAKGKGIPVRKGYVSRELQREYIAEMDMMGRLNSDAAEVVAATTLNGAHA